ncbi:hypothetical protein JCM6882_008068 [Rhodosporidiobolus microsporus]
MSDYHYRDTPDRAPPPRRGSRGEAYYDSPGGGGERRGYRDDDYYERPPPPPGFSRGAGGRGGRRGGGYDDRRGGGRGYGGGEFDDGGRGGKRRRSASPPPRGGRDDYYDSRPPPPGRGGDRYDDGPRYRGDREGGYGGPRGNGDAPPGGFDGGFGGQGGTPGRPIPTLEAPHQLPYPVTYRYFSQWFHQTSPPSLADSPSALADAWKKYESDLVRREAKAAFEGFKGWTWFGEKYASGEEREQERRERRRRQGEGKREEWVEMVGRGELDGLTFDFDESLVPRRPSFQPNAAHFAAQGLPVPEPAAPAASAAESNGAREDKDPDEAAEEKVEVKNENGEKNGTEVKKEGDGEDKDGDAAMSAPAPAAAEEDDKKPSASASPKKEDSASLPPAPTEGAGEAKPAPSPEMILVPGRPEQVIVSRVPGEVAFKELEALFLPLPGFVRLSLSEPAPHARFIRLAWATFDSAESAKAAVEEVQGKWVEPVAVPVKTEEGVEGEKKEEQEGGDEEMKPAEGEEDATKRKEEQNDSAPADSATEEPKQPSPVPPAPYSLLSGAFNLSAPGILSIRTDAAEARVRAAPALMSTAERVKLDLENVGKVVEELERRAGEEAGEGEGEGRKGSEVLKEKREGWEKEVEERREGMEEEVYKKEMDEVAKRTLDLSLSYLRHAFHACYYCCVVCDSPEQLADMCPKHLRRADGGGNANRRQNELAWAEGFDKRLPLLFPRGELDVRDYGGESRDEELFRIVGPHVKQEEEGKFRCKECNKLFSARKFVEKHIALKHPDFIGDALDQVAFFNNYVLDPSRIPLAPFQCQSYLPSILAPPPPPPRPLNPRPANNSLADRIGPKRPRIEPRSLDGPLSGPPPPPPQGKALDPRAGRGANSYADLDGPGGAEDIVLQY